MDTAQVIAANLTAWMAATPALDTLKKIAVKSGVGFGTVQRAKNGDGNITVEKLTAIAAAFGRQPAELLVAPGPASAGEVLELRPKTQREERIEQINALLTQTDDFGVVAVLEKAKDAARDYPARRQESAL
ncbi:MAG: helix-turn-helix domain-containing protein [Thauera sp.]|jgi:transcriptional regulator with XRE-family HTH domain|uniref:helix-turn-helix domain-containing protein n=1 Tax=Thauera sp. TaxID=1905334 RepID=UPI001D909589|nr:helix-turn-helix transcriptional regulator [Thauera sp.]MCB1945729.1 helix-turn-helix transcriptional regulator [Thauera sp.]MCP5224541.1 helix-turn-helix transcriptional regulator [Thauera sp.]